MANHLPLILATGMLGGCTTRMPPTTIVEFKDPDVIKLIRERPLEDVPTEPAPGDDDLTKDTPSDASAALQIPVLAFQPSASPPPWHCFKATLGEDVEVGECFASAEICAKRRKKSAKAGSRVGACKEQPRAACLYLELPLRDWGGYACFESFAACYVMHEVYSQDTETRNVGSCEARRISET